MFVYIFNFNILAVSSVNMPTALHAGSFTVSCATSSVCMAIIGLLVST